MAYNLIESEGVLTLTICRPEKHNAINDEVMEGFEKALFYVHNHTEVKFLVITGEGEKSFCSGGDLSVFHALKTEEEAYGMLSKMGDILYRLATLPIPTIALVNGTAVGGGCEIATACDFRIVQERAKVGFIQGKLAITSGWGGGTFLIERSLKYDEALKMLLDPTPLNAEALIRNGWATAVYHDEGKESALAHFIENMINIHPDVHKAYKSIQLRKWQQTNLYNRVMEEIQECAKLWEKDAHHDAVQNFLNKSKS